MCTMVAILSRAMGIISQIVEMCWEYVIYIDVCQIRSGTGLLPGT